MKKILLLIFVLAATFAQNKIKLSEELEITKLKDGFFIVTHYFPWESNSLVVVTDNKNILLIDTPYEPEATKLLLSYINENYPDRKISAIITGFHIDNLGGVEILLDNKYDVYGPELTCKMLDERVENTRSKMLKWLEHPDMAKYRTVYQNIQFFKPNRLFDIEKGLKLNFKDETVEVYWPGKTHTFDNTVVYFEKNKILFGGCMILAADKKSTGFIEDADMKEWPVSVEKLKKKYTNAEIVIPHHGNAGKKDLIEHTFQILTKR